MSVQEAATGAEAAAEITRTATEQVASISSFSWSGYFMAIAVICLFLGVLWLALRFLKKKGGLRVFGISGDLLVESRIGLGPKKNLLLVRVRDKRLLLGVTDHHISRLAEFPLDEVEGEDPPHTGGRKRRFTFGGAEPEDEKSSSENFQQMLENADEKSQ